MDLREVIEGLVKYGMKLGFETKGEPNAFMFVPSYLVISLANIVKHLMEFHPLNSMT